MAVANPTCCCCIETDCCPNKLPDVLHGEFTNVFGCPAIDGLTITLVGGPAWSGEAMCGNQPVHVSLGCNVPMGGGDCTNLEIDWEIGSIGGISDLPESGCTCDPLYLKYLLTGIVQPGSLCCEENESVEIHLEITE